MKPDRCRHRNSWLIAAGEYEWCYECGAFRRLIETGPTRVTPVTPWCKPTGPGGANPWEAWERRKRTYQIPRRKP